MTRKSAQNSARNAYACAIEFNQNGKYCVRVRATFGRTGWVLPLYFLASSFGAGMKKLEQTLQHLQRREEALWFWGAHRSDDPKLAPELLSEMGLKLDRRDEFPKKHTEVAAAVERPVSPVQFAPLRRALAELLEPARVASD
ncbi:MAG TPA: hypothetical protein VMV61_09375 [Patescibacteria group bacterium]|nr:hypothetical protein [Patescibacteria group bacterium]